MWKLLWRRRCPENWYWWELGRRLRSPCAFLLCKLWFLWTASTGVLSSIIYLVNTVVLAEREERTCKLKRMEKIEQWRKDKSLPERELDMPGPWDREELSVASGAVGARSDYSDGMVVLRLRRRRTMQGLSWPLQGVCLLLFLFFSLKYSWATILYVLQVCNKVTHLYLYTHV